MSPFGFALPQAIYFLASDLTQLLAQPLILLVHLLRELVDI